MGSIKRPDSQCLEKLESPGATKAKINNLVGPKQWVLAIVLSKNGKYHGGILIKL